MLAFDLETTGIDPHSVHIVSAALVRIHGSEVTPLTMLADPGVEIPAEATAVHGITTEQAREHGRPHDEVAAVCAAALRQGWAQGATVVVYNAPYDLTIVQRFNPGFTIDGPVIDPSVIDRHIDPYRKGSRTLGKVCEFYKVRLAEAHNAEADALAAARLAWTMAKQRPDLTEQDWQELNARQAGWHKERMRSYADYLRSRGKSADRVNGEWPVQTTRQASA